MLKGIEYDKHVKTQVKVSSNESSYLEELAYIDFSEETRSPWLPDNGKQAYKLTKLVEYVMRFALSENSKLFHIMTVSYSEEITLKS